MKRKRILFFGHSYYHTYYLAKELKKRGWVATTLNFDDKPENALFYHGQDIQFTYGSFWQKLKHLFFYIKALFTYDIFHFCNARGMKMLHDWYPLMNPIPFIPMWWDIKLLKKLGKKIVYSNNGCNDGVLKSTFAQWGYFDTCSICNFRDNPRVCSVEWGHEWGQYRNSVADFQVSNGGNRADYNTGPTFHDVPEFYCLDKDLWSPDLMIPSNYMLPLSADTVKVYHAVGNYGSRSKKSVNPKTTHVYLPLIDKMKAQGYPVELIFVNDVPNEKVKYYQLQADIVVDMLTFGWFGANIREAMMLGKPCICYINPEWLESVRMHIPEYANELPIISATIDTVEDVLKDLVQNKAKREEIGKRSRAFAVKWHASDRAAVVFDAIYSSLLEGKKFERTAIDVVGGDS